MPPLDDTHVGSADIRGFYAALGLHLPDWATVEASVHCFADPDAHRRADRNPSCRVNLTHGAWTCHGCGASGGPYDAAINQGHTSRSAIDLMICHGLAQRRPSPSRRRQHPIAASSYVCPRVDRAVPRAARFTVSETDISRWRRALESDSALVARLVSDRGWQVHVMQELELGVNRGRITIPVRDQRQRLVGLLRYRPWSRPEQAKMRAAVGSRRQLLPNPAGEQSESIWLVEGEPDMIAARSAGLPAIAVPGSETWRPEWAPSLAGREVTIVMDCDGQGRAATVRIAQDLHAFADTRVLDLAPERDDGFDLTNWLATRTPADLERLR